MKPSFLFLAAAIVVGLMLTLSCTRIVAKMTGMGRKFPGMSPKTIKKISKETGVPETSIVYPDMVAGGEIMEELVKEGFVYPLAFVLDSAHRQMALPDTFTQNKCTGLLMNFLQAGDINLNPTETVRKGGFYHPLDTTIRYQYAQGKEQLVLVYMYELGRVMKGFYKTMSRNISQKPENRELWLVVLSR